MGLKQDQGLLEKQDRDKIVSPTCDLTWRERYFETDRDCVPVRHKVANKSQDQTALTLPVVYARPTQPSPSS